MIDMDVQTIDWPDTIEDLEYTEPCIKKDTEASWVTYWSCPAHGQHRVTFCDKHCAYYRDGDKDPTCMVHCPTEPHVEVRLSRVFPIHRKAS